MTRNHTRFNFDGRSMTSTSNRLCAVASECFKAKRATVQVTKDKKASAKLLWEAVEAAGYKPAKLIGADGTHTAKPKA